MARGSSYLNGIMMVEPETKQPGHDAATLAFYAEEAPVYAASGKHGEFKHLAGFLERLDAGASILELGCGGGLDAEFMINRGFDVDATDGTPEIAAQAEARLKRPVRVMRFEELNATDRYDAVVAAASLLHVPRLALPDILARVWSALKPGGWHIASYKGGGSEGRDRFGRYFNYMEAEELRAVYCQAGEWAQWDVTSGVGGGYDSKQGNWHTVTVQKPK
jgi:SAM-dependent methyltransferase